MFPTSLERLARISMVLLAMALITAVPITAAAASPDWQVEAASPQDVKIDADKIYYGNANAWTRAAVVKGLDIIKATPAWKEMKSKGIKKGDPSYDLYFHKAKKEALDAIEKAGKKFNPAYDLVGEVGSIAIKGRVVPNITDSVLQELDE